MPTIYGVNPVLEALRAGRPLDRVVVALGFRNERLRDVIAAARAAGVPVGRQPVDAVERAAGARRHQGVVAWVAASRYASLEAVLQRLLERRPALLLDGVEDPRNLGAVIRAAECAGAAGIVIPERGACGLTDVVAKTSAGAIEHLPVARVTNLVRAMEQFKEAGAWVYGLDGGAPATVYELDLTGPTALVLGGEGRGLRRLVREHCDALAAIPMLGRVTSLNVSVAAGIVLFEAVRQQRVSEESCV
jgi:23S rRNA (guanosine2251-2'-O)-methyltransferase